MECLGAIKWDHPAIVAVAAAVAAAVVTGIFLIVTALIKRSKSPSPAVVVMPAEKDVGEELSKALGLHSARIEALIEALREQLAAAQLAPKQPVPDPDDPLKVKAVELLAAAIDAYEKGVVVQPLGRRLDALQLGADFPDAHNNLGVAMKAKGDLDAAVEHYKAALRIKPDHVIAHNNLGNALMDKGELEAAIEYYNAALRIDPDYANAYFNLGCALTQKKDAAAAVPALAKAIELDSKFRDMAKSDTDYDPIRDDPAFRKLVYGD